MPKVKIFFDNNSSLVGSGEVSKKKNFKKGKMHVKGSIF